MDRLKLILAVLPFLIFMSWAYYQRIGAFGCFDDFFNIAAGYFIGKDKTLYSEIFFNHQPLMAYLSYIIQSVRPDSLYQLILYHRIFIILFSFLANILLITRLGWPGLGFALLYETTKYYMFGDRFLAESLIVYPIVFLFGLIWLKLKGEVVSKWELIISAVFTWFVVFIREPFVPIALVLYASFLWTKSFSKKHIFSLLLFSILTLATIGVLPLKEYIFNVFEVNSAVEVSATQVYNNLPRILAYPLFIFFQGQWNFLKPILVALSIIFTVSAAIYGVRLKRLKQVLFVIFILGLANIRVVQPSTMFYEAFHMTVWYGLFIAATLLILQELNRKIRIVGLLVLVAIFIYSISPGSFLYEKIDRRHEFTTNYAHYFVQGEVVRILSKPTDTLFVDGFDELISQQANLNSPYKYSLYTSVMPRFTKYTDEREKMFVDAPPDFYYGNCKAEHDPSGVLPPEQKNNYIKLYFSGKPTCLHVRKAKLKEISEKQLEEVKTNFGFDILD